MTYVPHFKDPEITIIVNQNIVSIGVMYSKSFYWEYSSNIFETDVKAIVFAQTVCSLL